MNITKVLIILFLMNIVLEKITFCQSAFEYLRQALARTAIFSALQVGYEYKDNLCIAGVLLRNGENSTLKFYLERDNNYRIMGIADEDVLDLDLFLEDSQGRILVQDAKDDNLPIINFSPSSSGQYTIRIKNYRANTTSFCIMVLLKENKYSTLSLPSSILLTEALDNIVDLSELYSLTGTKFIPNTFCLFGGLYNSGVSDGIMNIQIPSGEGGNYLILAAGSDNTKDVDLEVIKQTASGQTTGNTIGQDKKIVKIAIVTCDIWSWNYYYIKYTNYQSSGKAFVFVVFMKDQS